MKQAVLQVLAGIFCAVGPALLFAQAPADTMEIKGEQVHIVAPAIIESNIIETGGTEMTVVSSRQVADMQALDVPSALRRVPGVLISRHNLVGNYGGGDGGTIYIRGMGSERPGASIQMMVDGVPKFVGVWTHPLMDVLSVDHLDQLQVHKSPRPVLFGNMALGTVNLVSRRMAADGYRTDLSIMGGAHQTFQSGFNHGGKKNRFDYYIGAAMKQSDGHRPQADGETQSYWGRFGYTVSPHWDATVILNGTSNWARDPGAAGSPAPSRARFNINDVTVNATLSNTSARGRGFLRYYRDDGHINWEQYDSAVPEPFNSVTNYLNQGVRLQQQFSVLTNTQVTAGFDFDRYGGRFVEERPSGDKPKPDTWFSNTAGYLTVSQTIPLGTHCRFMPSAGVRINRHNTFETETAPECGLLLSAERWDWRFNYARGFNYAGIYAAFLYADWNRGDTYANLQAEHVQHVETGVQYRFTPRTSFDLTLFNDRGTNLIRFVAPPPPPPSFTNTDRFRITGVEATWNWSPTHWSSFFTGGTFLHTAPDNFPYAPHYIITFGGNFRFADQWQLTADVSSIGDRYAANERYNTARVKMDAYTIINAKLAWMPPKFSGSSVFVAAENLADASYEYKPAYPMPGITLFSGLSLGF